MKLFDDTLMAYADGELDEGARRQVEQAMQADPAIAARVDQHRALRQQLQRAYAPLPDAPPPPRLSALFAAGKTSAGAPPPRPKVVHLDSVRSAHGRRPLAGGAAIAPPPLRWPWQIWLALAAALLVGIGAGVLGVTGYHSETQFAGVNGNGLLRAHGKLAAALDGQLASLPQPRGNLRVGVSFVGRDGQYCRAFELGAAAGLACRAGAGWNIPVFVEGQGAAGSYRAVGSALPAAVMAAIDARAVGPALDGAAERAAAARGWSR